MRMMRVMCLHCLGLLRMMDKTGLVYKPTRDKDGVMVHYNTRGEELRLAARRCFTAAELGRIEDGLNDTEYEDEVTMSDQDQRQSLERDPDWVKPVRGGGGPQIPTMMYVIVEDGLEYGATNLGLRCLGTVDHYGGPLMPGFESREGAEAYIASIDDNIRELRVVEIQIQRRTT